MGPDAYRSLKLFPLTGACERSVLDRQRGSILTVYRYACMEIHPRQFRTPGCSNSRALGKRIGA